jgi:hypothetical protein
LTFENFIEHDQQLNSLKAYKRSAAQMATERLLDKFLFFNLVLISSVWDMDSFGKLAITQVNQISWLRRNIFLFIAMLSCYPLQIDRFEFLFPTCRAALWFVKDLFYKIFLFRNSKNK